MLTLRVILSAFWRTLIWFIQHKRTADGDKRYERFTFMSASLVVILIMLNLTSAEFRLSARQTSQIIANKQRTNRHHSAHHDHRSESSRLSKSPFTSHRSRSAGIVINQNQHKMMTRRREFLGLTEKLFYWLERRKKIRGLASCFLSVFLFTPPLNFIFKL